MKNLVNIFNEAKDFIEIKEGYIPVDEIIEAGELSETLALFQVLAEAFDIDASDKEEVEAALKNLIESPEESDLEVLVDAYESVIGFESDDKEEEIAALFANLVALKNTLEKIDDEKYIELQDALFDFYVNELEKSAEKIEEQEEIINKNEEKFKKVIRTYYLDDNESVTLEFYEDINNDESVELESLFEDNEDVEESIDAKRKCKKRIKRINKKGELISESEEDCDCPKGVEEGTIIEEIITEDDEDENEIKEEFTETEEIKEESIEIENVEDISESNNKEKIKIVNPKEKVSTKPWSKVDKIELKHKFKEMLDNNVPGVKDAIKETFALVRSFDKMGDWKYPHHELENNEVILNTNGLRAAVVFLVRKRSLQALTKEERKEIAKHLIKHYNELEREVPPSLRKIAEGKNESIVYLNIDDEELNELKESFNVNEEDILTIIAIMEDFLSDLAENGIIELEESINPEGEIEIIKTINKEQLKALIEVFDKFSEKIVKILNGQTNAIDDIKDESILEEITNLKAEVKSYLTMIEKLKNEIEEEKLKKEELKEQLKEKEESLKQLKILETKYKEIVKYIKDNVDDVGLRNYIEAVDEANDMVELKAIKKLKESILNPTLKKRKILKSDDTERIIEILGETGVEEKEESVKIEKDITHLLKYL